ncbi:low molecular weight protein-tyrosine-phosphatase [Hoeflea sp. TYP-13]|uniref:low molecular weight protein-tyrosine-phosphatase n=1 Tax=Hoeflea sp. TYP-13 TaxID=3230023 RepID=UPI0034C5E42A
MAANQPDSKTRAILFLCLGNICRSALAEGILRDLAVTGGKEGLLTIDSAGTGGWHVGEAPDPRAISKAAEHGVDISGQRGRQVGRDDFDRFDLILAMDRSNLETLRARAPGTHRAELHQFMVYTQGRNEDVPDPYYGGPEGFETVYRMLKKGCLALLDDL